MPEVIIIPISICRFSIGFTLRASPAAGCADVDLLLRGEHPMQKRLAFEELIAHQISLQKSRRQVRRHSAVALTAGDDLRDQLLNRLVFNLTAAQQRVIAEIDADLSQPYPMLRLSKAMSGLEKPWWRPWRCCVRSPKCSGGIDCADRITG